MRLAQAVELLVGLALVVATASAARAAWQGAPPPDAWRTVGAVVFLSGAWLLVNGPVEGPTLAHVAPGHGLTAADLLAVPALASAGLLLWAIVRQAV